MYLSHVIPQDILLKYFICKSTQKLAKAINPNFAKKAINPNFAKKKKKKLAIL